MLSGLFALSDPCCVKKGNKYPSFILIIFAREKRIIFWDAQLFSSLPKLLLPSFVTLASKNKTKQNSYIRYVCSEPILFLTFSHASLLISHTAAVLALALLFMIPAFLLWLSHVLHFSAKIYLTSPKTNKQTKKPCWSKSRSFCSSACVSQILVTKSRTGERGDSTSFIFHWKGMFIVAFQGSRRAVISMEEISNNCSLSWTSEIYLHFGEDIGAHSCPFWIGM